jgi:glycine/D-amino acid oxidase-like deaminating enzyme
MNSAQNAEPIRRHSDVVVVGARCSAATALGFARNGRSVLLLDRMLAETAATEGVNRSGPSASSRLPRSGSRRR